MKLLLLIVCSLSLSAGLESKDEFQTKDHLVILKDELLQFVQVSLDYKVENHLFTIPLVETETKIITEKWITQLKVKSIGPQYYLYWLEQVEGKEMIHETKIAKHGYSTDRVLTTITETGYLHVRFDIHPTLDLMYITSEDDGLIEFNTTTSVSRKLVEGKSFYLAMLDMKNNNIYYVICDELKLVQFNIKNNLKVEYHIDECYENWVADFDKNEIYFTSFLSLYKASPLDFQSIDENKNRFEKDKIVDFNVPISSIALGQDFIYVATFYSSYIFEVSRRTNALHPSPDFKNGITRLYLYREIENDPKIPNDTPTLKIPDDPKIPSKPKIPNDTPTLKIPDDPKIPSKPDILNDTPIPDDTKKPSKPEIPNNTPDDTKKPNDPKDKPSTSSASKDMKFSFYTFPYIMICSSFIMILNVI